MALPAHFFISDDGGSLHDTRDPLWASHPLRVNYRRHHRGIDSAEDLKAALRAGEFTDVGGYPLYFVTGDNRALSFESVRANFRECLAGFASPYRQDEWRIVACGINFEDADLRCEESGKLIPSAYGEDD